MDGDHDEPSDQTLPALTLDHTLLLPEASVGRYLTYDVVFRLAQVVDHLIVESPIGDSGSRSLEDLHNLQEQTIDGLVLTTDFHHGEVTANINPTDDRLVYGEIESVRMTQEGHGHIVGDEEEDTVFVWNRPVAPLPVNVVPPFDRPRVEISHDSLGDDNEEESHDEESENDVESGYLADHESTDHVPHVPTVQTHPHHTHIVHHGGHPDASGSDASLTQRILESNERVISRRNSLWQGHRRRTAISEAEMVEPDEEILRAISPHRRLQSAPCGLDAEGHPEPGTKRPPF